MVEKWRTVFAKVSYQRLYINLDSFLTSDFVSWLRRRFLRLQKPSTGSSLGWTTASKELVTNSRIPAKHNPSVRWFRLRQSFSNLNQYRELRPLLYNNRSYDVIVIDKANWTRWPLKWSQTLSSKFCYTTWSTWQWLKTDNDCLMGRDDVLQSLGNHWLK